MDERTHYSKMVVDPKTGKTRQVWCRSAKTVVEMEKLRLGPLYEMEDLTQRVFCNSLKKIRVIFIATLKTAQRAIRTRLRKDHSLHKIVNGTQILEAYLGGSDSYLSGWDQFEQLFILFSYSESTNRRLPELVNELIGLRGHLGKHVWLFIPKDLGSLSLQWGEVIRTLDYLEVIRLEAESEEDLRGPQSSAVVLPSQIGSSSILSNPVSDDPKFAGKDKKRYRR